MAGTIIITGANGSIAMPAIHHLLTHYPDLTAILTVRDASDADIHTAKLRAIIAGVAGAKASIHQLDHASLSAVHKFADDMLDGIDKGRYPPLKSIICNAFYWNLVADGELTEDGYEKTLQINHIAHAALILRLLGSFHPDSGRVVVLSSNAHWPGKNGLEKYPPGLPDNLDLLAKVEPDADRAGRGFQRYANSKLAATTFVNALNRRLEKEPSLRHITAIAVDPGSISDSRALRMNTPRSLAIIQKFVLQPLRPILRFTDPTLRTAEKAGEDTVELAIGQAHPGERGFFNLLDKGQSSPESMDQDKQHKVWTKSLEWAGITEKNSRVWAALV